MKFLIKFFAIILLIDYLWVHHGAPLANFLWGERAQELKKLVLLHKANKEGKDLDYIEEEFRKIEQEKLKSMYRKSMAEELFHKLRRTLYKLETTVDSMINSKEEGRK